MMSQHSGTYFWNALFSIVLCLARMEQARGTDVGSGLINSPGALFCYRAMWHSDVKLFL